MSDPTLGYAEVIRGGTYGDDPKYNCAKGSVQGAGSKFGGDDCFSPIGSLRERENRDIVYYLNTPRATILIVASCNDDSFLANLGAQLLVRTTARCLYDCLEGLNWEHITEESLSFAQRMSYRCMFNTTLHISCARFLDCGTIAQMAMFENITISGAVIAREETTVFTHGNGYVSINGVPIVILNEGFPHSRIDDTHPWFTITHQTKTSCLQSLLLGTFSVRLIQAIQQRLGDRQVPKRIRELSRRRLSDLTVYGARITDAALQSWLSEFNVPYLCSEADQSWIYPGLLEEDTSIVLATRRD